MEFPPFPGFRPQAFSFLRGLAKNNEREWFKAHKSTFDDELMWPMRCLVVDAGRQCQSAGLQLTGDPKKSVFRIYRDTRFSKNKAPYKTHVAAVLSANGSTKEQGGIYIHVEPRNCFMASGFWDPDSALLGKLRSKIASKPADFLELVDYLNDKEIPLGQHGEGLKRMPRGFETHADSEVAAYLKWKSFIVTRKSSQKELAAPQFVEEVVRFGIDIQPLRKYVG